MDLQSNQSTAPLGGVGYLIVRVTTARGAIPLEDAEVSVRNELPELSPEAGDVLLSVRTGRDGSTPVIPLEAPPKANSQIPDNGLPVLQRYQIEVRRSGYRDEDYVGVPIFDGITAIQTVDLLPLPENVASDGFSPYSGRLTETPENSL